MSQEHEKIERMVQQGKLTRAEADELLAALEPEETEQPRPPHPGGAALARVGRSASTSTKPAANNVDLGFPMALAGVGLNILARRGKATIDVDGKQVPIDIDEIRRLITDPDFVGELMNVHTSDGSTVVLSVE